MSQKNSLLLFLLFLILSLRLTAQEGVQKKIELLESRLLVLEDYLKTRLYEMQKRIEETTAKITTLEENKALLKNEIANLQEKLKLAEAEILNLKITLAALQKTSEPAPLSAAPEKAPLEKKESVAVSYRNPEIQALHEKLLSPLSNVRLGAILQLSKHPDTQADLALVFALSDSDNYNKILTCKALGKRKSQRAREPLFQLLEKADAEMVPSLLDALTKITGFSEPFPQDGSPAEKKTAIQRWREKSLK